MTAGSFHSIVLKQDGSVWATGSNDVGQLGAKSTRNWLRYVQVVTDGAKALATGRRHSVMLKQDGSVWTTGYNVYGQLGDGSTINNKIFMQVISDGVIFI